MKNLFTTLFILLLSLNSIAQNSINYKAVIKDASGSILESAPLNIQFTVYQGAALTNAVYQENHTVNTDDNGIVIVNIGEGTTGDNFASIAWESDEHFLNVQVNIGAGLVDLGTTKFQTVPYALVAKDVENSIWDKDGSGDVTYTDGRVGIGIANPANTFSVLQPTGNANTVRIETQDHPYGKDLLELKVPAGATSGSQFIEMENGGSIVAAINSDGSAEFKSVRFNDNTVQTTAAVGPVAYGFVESDGTVTSGSGNFTANWNATIKRYGITISGENYFWNQFTTIVTGSFASIDRIRVTSSNGQLLIFLYNEAGALIQGHFQFITYK